jgi:hypothetical protein
MLCRQIAFLLAGLTLAACADQTASRSTAATDPSNATRIETDQNNGFIRFIVNGREQARIDGTGLHVQQGADAATVTLRGSSEKAAK